MKSLELNKLENKKAQPAEKGQDNELKVIKQDLKKFRIRELKRDLKEFTKTKLSPY